MSPAVVEPRAAAALARAAALGPYFAVQLGTSEGPWRAFEELFTAQVLRENVAGVRRVLSERTRIPLAELDLRACASTHFLALASRVLAPAFGAAVLTGHCPRLPASGLQWLRVEGGPVPVAVLAAQGEDCADAQDAARALQVGLIGPVILPLVLAFQNTFVLSRQVLWGNVASALNGAATMLARGGGVTVIDPAVVVAAALESGPLFGMAAVQQESFRRNNCCLFYKIPGGGMCGDCVLIGVDTRRGI